MNATRRAALGLCGLALAALAVPAWAANDDDIQRGFDAFKAAMAAKDEAALPADEPADGLYAYYDGVGRKALGLDDFDPERGTLFDHYSIALVRGLHLCPYFREGPAYVQSLLKNGLTARGLIALEGRQGGVLPWVEAKENLKVAGILGGSAAVDYRWEFTRENGSTIGFDDQIEFKRDKGHWILVFESYLQAIDRNGLVVAAVVGSSMRQPQSTQGLDDDSDRHFRIRNLALRRAATSLREECPPFADRLAKLRAANDNAAVLKLFYGVRDLMALPMAEWPKTETLAWWGT
ncbi:MAG: hypothetical protein AB7M05_06895 [Alphaproteobacteria bacterium]